MQSEATLNDFFWVLRMGSASQMTEHLRNSYTESERITMLNKDELMFDAGATRITTGRTPLMTACSGVDSQMVKVLLDFKADPNFQRKQCRKRKRCRHRNTTAPYDALSTAVAFGRLEIVRTLLYNKCHINAGPHLGCTSLFMACEIDNTNIVRVLLQSSADPNCTLWSNAMTPLMACRSNSVCSLLLESKASVNATDSNGQTALMHCSARDNSKAVARILLDSTCNMCVRDNAGETALSLAEKVGKDSGKPSTSAEILRNEAIVKTKFIRQKAQNAIIRDIFPAHPCLRYIGKEITRMLTYGK